MLMLASSSSSPRHRGRIERGVDGGDHRVIGGRAGEMCGNRLQEMIALSDRQRRRRALQQRELLVRECEGTRSGHAVFPSWRICARAGPARLIGAKQAGRVKGGGARGALFQVVFGQAASPSTNAPPNTPHSRAGLFREKACLHSRRQLFANAVSGLTGCSIAVGGRAISRKKKPRTGRKTPPGRDTTRRGLHSITRSDRTSLT
jgi:hypothetical protein